MTPSESSAGHPGSRRRRTIFAILAVVGALIAVVTVASRSGGEESGDDDDPVEVTTAAVEQRDVIRSEEFDATVAHGEAVSLPNQAQGHLTSAPVVGDEIAFGEELYRLDDQPVFLLPGSTPAWRPLSWASSAEGEDVRQLQQWLLDAGYAAVDELTVDGVWGSATTTAVQAWQEAEGLDATGEVALGSVVFQSTPVIVDSVGVSLGEEASGAVLSVTPNSWVLSADVDEDSVTLFSEGDEVPVELGDGTQATGRVVSIEASESDDSGSDGAVMPGGGGNGDTGTTSYVVTVEVTDVDLSAAGVEDAVLSVELEADRDTLAVPVTALLALAEGGYAVEVPQGSTTELVPVEIDTSSDGWVAITGDLHSGDEVVVPS